MAPMGKGFLKIKKVAAHLDCSRSQIYDLIYQGELMAIRVGSALRIFKESLEDFEERHRVQDSERNIKP